MEMCCSSRRLISLLLAGLMVVMAPLCSYAQDHVLATGSNAETDAKTDAETDVDVWIDQMTDMIEAEPPAEPVDIESLAEYDPLAGLTDEQYEAYCQTFMEHPRTLLEWPEGLPQYRFAVTLSAAAVYVLYLLAAAVGIVFTWNFASWVQGYDGYEFFSGFEQYMRVMHAGADDFWASWDAVMNATWGKAITGVKTMYTYLKEYCTARMEGYGTEQPSYSIPNTGNALAITEDGTYQILHGTTFTFRLSRISGPIYGYAFNLSSRDKSKAIAYLVSESKFYIEGFPASHDSHFYFTPAWVSLDAVLNNDYFTILSEFDDTGIEGDVGAIFSSVFTPEFAFGQIGSSSITPDKVIPDAQAKPFVSPGDTLTLPADQVAADTLAENVSAATDAASLSGALTGTWDLGDTAAEGEEDKTYPWVPDITGWLEKLLHGIEAVPGEVAGELSGIGDKVDSLPGSIAQALENTLIGEDDGTYQISQVVTDKFPFCVPFDLVGCFRVLQAPATPPVWRIPFVVDNSFIHINEEIVIDLSDWERPAAVIRFFVLLMFIFGLAYVTRYVVKG